MRLPVAKKGKIKEKKPKVRRFGIFRVFSVC